MNLVNPGLYTRTLLLTPVARISYVRQRTARESSANAYNNITSVDAKHHGASLSERWNVTWVHG